MRKRERFRICEVPNDAYFFHRTVLLMPSHAVRLLPLSVRHDCCAAMTEPWELRRAVRRSIERNTFRQDSAFFSNGFAAIWTIFQDTPIALFTSCCATFGSVWLRMSSFSHALLPPLPVR